MSPKKDFESEGDFILDETAAKQFMASLKDEGVMRAGFVAIDGNHFRGTEDTEQTAN
ncbi:hypothetical protein [Micromonospora sp. NPDC047074]|uniref:hypothetical protein n=1 Tax=Micromonospora sp. NPDC047074 TaxID=3154339 RepID=UPI0033FB8287